MNTLYLAATFGGLSVLAALPLLCIMDIRKRKIPDTAWAALLALNIPALWTLYTDIHGIPQYYLGLSFVLAAMYLFFRVIRLYGGADAKGLATIAIVAPLNPINILAPVFQAYFFIAFALAMCVLNPLYMKSRWYNPVRGTPVMVIAGIAYIVAILVNCIMWS